MAITVDANALLLKSHDLGDSSGTLIEVDVARAGWEFTGLTVMKLGAGERWSRETGPDEVALVPLGRALHGRLRRPDLDHRRAGQTRLPASPGPSICRGTARSRSPPRRRSSWPSAPPAPSDGWRRS